MNKEKIVLLAGKGVTTHILYNALKNDFNIQSVILEDHVAKKEYLRKRIRRFGVRKVTGQLMFQLSVVKLLHFVSAKRKQEILREFKLDSTPLPNEKIIPVQSVNDDECIATLQKINPAIVVVIGTRIISKRVLDCIGARFVNIHAGITPKYRNVHGAYWALVNNDHDNCGVTVHLVDEGIDTGSVLYQTKISVTPKDNFITYPFLQLAEGITYLKRALLDIFEERVVIKSGTADSSVWTHPTFFEYVYHRLVHQKK